MDGPSWGVLSEPAVHPETWVNNGMNGMTARLYEIPPEGKLHVIRNDILSGFGSVITVNREASTWHDWAGKSLSFSNRWRLHDKVIGHYRNIQHLSNKLESITRKS